MEQTPTASSPLPYMEPDSNRKFWLGLVIGLIIATSIALAYWYLDQAKTSTSTSNSAPTSPLALSSAQTDKRLGWKTVTSQANNFSLKYPTTWQVDAAYHDTSDPKNGYHDPFLNNFNSVTGASKGYELTAKQSKLVYKATKGSSLTVAQEVADLKKDLTGTTEENINISSETAVLLTGSTSSGPDAGGSIAYLVIKHSSVLYTFQVGHNVAEVKDILTSLSFIN